jgi:predicted HTH domain antitoxin
MSSVLDRQLPADLEAALQAAGFSPERIAEEAYRHFAAILFARRTLSLEQAATLADMTLWDFIPFLGEQGIPVADYDAEEIQKELETSRWLATLRKT